MIMGKIRSLAKGQPTGADGSSDKTLSEGIGGENEAGASRVDSSAVWPARPNGPWDISEVGDTEGFVDLGSMMLKPASNVEVRVEVHQESGQVARVAAINGDAAVNLQPFAAAKSTPIWPELSKKISAQAAEAGAKSKITSGDFGDELIIDDGSRWVGIDGPRWVLRCVYSGSAQTPGSNKVLEEFVKSVVVVRGANAIPPGDALPIKMPEQANPQQT